MDTCPTVKVKPWADGLPAVVVINEADFDKSIHTKFTAAELAKLENPDAPVAEAAAPVEQ